RNHSSLHKLFDSLALSVVLLPKKINEDKNAMANIIFFDFNLKIPLCHLILKYSTTKLKAQILPI
ncbi:hypothetical protein, partial [Lactobacillus helveticus]|uniref:hypothetical protein n=1 Tax=Lactobacillus helveticus TaxID=1587 RepID=UPI001C27754E